VDISIVIEMERISRAPTGSAHILLGSHWASEASRMCCGAGSRTQPGRLCLKISPVSRSIGLCLYHSKYSLGIWRIVSTDFLQFYSGSFLGVTLWFRLYLPLRFHRYSRALFSARSRTTWYRDQIHS